MEKLYAFVDEYGNESLKTEKGGVTTNYIVAAVVVNEEQADPLRAEALQIGQDFFSGGEMKSKSKSVSKNHDRRVQILERLGSLDHHVHILSVDKSKLSESSGLIHKQPFRKYLNGRLYKRLCKSTPKVHIVTDQHGGQQFMDSFQSYVEKTHFQSDMFSEQSFGFADSQSEPLIQVADFYAGSVARVFDIKKFTDESREVLDVIRPRVLSLEHWPPRLRGFVEPPELENEAEEMIRSQSHRIALSYLEEHYNSNSPEDRYRCEALGFLLYRLRYDDPGSFTPTWEIMQAVEAITGVEFKEQPFRSEVIGKLRDNGVMIVSNTSGYKLAESFAELSSFVTEVDRRVQPQLARIATFRDNVLSVSGGDIDIFEGHPSYIQEAIASIREST